MYDFLMWAAGIIISLGAAITGWVFKMVFDAIKDQRTDHENAVKEARDEHQRIERSLSAHKLYAAQTFATKVDVQSGFDKVMLKLENISNKFDRFDEKLDKKADKSDV